MRPLGAILFGEMGDRMVGRRNALVFSIVLITVPSVAMGLLPTYEMWGTAAPILLVILRMMQGLSVGGQLAGSYVLSIEQSSSATRGFRGSICTASSVSKSNSTLDTLSLCVERTSFADFMIRSYTIRLEAFYWLRLLHLWFVKSYRKRL